MILPVFRSGVIATTQWADMAAELPGFARPFYCSFERKILKYTVFVSLV
jgi:hypothetical protein